MDHSSDNSCPIFPIDDLSIICPEISLWDSPFDQILYPSDNTDRNLLADDSSKGKAAAAEGSPAMADQKKVMHRDIERQRRQEMSGLYANLRSVLPADVLKGKRSISDQIHEATKYIKFLEKSIRDLGGRRNELLPETTSGGCGRVGPPPVVVTVEACSVGVEVLISGDFSSLPLSRVLQMLAGEGLNVVSCNFTKFDGRWCYIIQSEVPGGSLNVYLQMLRRKLTALVNTLVDIPQ